MPQVTVATTGIRLLNRNTERLSLWFENLGTVTVHCARMQATALTTTNSELAIPAVSGKGLDWFTDGYEVVTDEWVAIAA